MGRQWAKTIGLFLLGRLTESDLLAVARREDGATPRAMSCEAFYFAGMVRGLSNDPEGARTLLEQSVATNQTQNSMYAIARAELERLRALADK